MSIFASQMIEDGGGLASLTDDNVYMVGQALILVICIALSIRNAVRSTNIRVQLTRTALFYLGITLIAVLWVSTMGRIVVLLLGVGHCLVPVHNKQPARTDQQPPE
ncbi:hypothetical protein ACGE24_07100 [Corynebacterium kroppenstedtii]|uniref:hypothetical protein n=1 Tax=Corynebacterium sp. PCR 32 TaxID=3351342 RepID=UPI00309BB288